MNKRKKIKKNYKPPPRLYVNLKKIESNTRRIVQLAKKQGISITGVTKATCGDSRIAEAMIEGGATSIGDSRIENIKHMKEEGVDVDMMLLRTPMMSKIPEVVSYADISLNSEINVIKKLSEEAAHQKTIHRIILMIEFGERREGLTKKEIHNAIKVTRECSGVELYGIGTNLACLTGVVPTEEKMDAFDSFVEELECICDIRFTIVGGGNSANIPLLLKGKRHRRINNLRIGEGILLGRETVTRSPISEMYQDAFILEGELIEVKVKPSLPNGKISQNAYGETPKLVDSGIMKRGLVALGRQDIMTTGLTPKSNEISIVGSSSDHLALDMGDNERTIGDTVKFELDYGALVQAFTSPYVKTVYLNDEPSCGSAIN